MKTAYCLRMFVVVATMATISCSEPEIEVDPPKQPPSQTPPVVSITPAPAPTNTNSANNKFYTNVTTWTRTDSAFVGLVSVLPYPFVSWTRLYGIHNDQEIGIDNRFDSARVETAQSMFGAYFWANRQSNILLIYHVGATPELEPPFPLQIVIEY